MTAATCDSMGGSSGGTGPEPVLSVHKVQVRFGGQPALDDVDFAVLPGQVHALIGHNGAGKSTLAACLTKQLTPDHGRLHSHGHVALVTQHPQVINDKPLAATVWLGREPGLYGRVDPAQAIANTKALAQRYNIDLETLGIDPAALGRTIDVTQRHIVALLGALASNPTVLIADEVTAGSSREDRTRIVDVLANVAGEGVGVVMITHHADEVLQVAHTVTALRSAKAFGPIPIDNLDRNTIRQAMSGQIGKEWKSKELLGVSTVNQASDLSPDIPASMLDSRKQPFPPLGDASKPSKPAESVMSTPGGPPASDYKRTEPLNQPTTITLQTPQTAKPSSGSGLQIYQRGAHRPILIPPGQITVVLGAPADGVDTLVSAITGLGDDHGWHAHLNGTALQDLSLGARQQLGLGWVPDDRSTYGPAPNLSIAQNVAMAVPGEPVWSPNGWLRPGKLADTVQNMLTKARALNQVPAKRTIAQCSGGQAQAVMVGRALAANPKALLLCNPAHGMDPAAMADLANTLNATAQAGCAIVIATTDVTFAQMVGDDFWRAANGVIRPIPSLSKPEQVERLPQEPEITRRSVFTIPGPLLALAIAIGLAGAIVSLWGANPIEVLNELVGFAWGTTAGLGAMLAHVVPIVVIAAGIVVMFKAEVISIGAEGQLYMGALAGALMAQSQQAPGWLVAVAALGAGAMAGALWAVPVAWVKARLNANEIVATLILNTLGLLTCSWLVAGPFNGGRGALTSAAINPSARLVPNLIGPIGLDVIIALLVLVAVSVVMARTRWGLGVTYLGQGIERAKAVGINPARTQAQVLMIGGALAGLAGALVVLGPSGGRFNMVFSPGYGFIAIMVALIGAYRGWGIGLGALGFSTLMAGAGAIQLSSGIPLAITGVIQGVIVLTVTMRLALPALRPPKTVLASGPGLSPADSCLDNPTKVLRSGERISRGVLRSGERMRGEVLRSGERMRLMVLRSGERIRARVLRSGECISGWVLRSGERMRLMVLRSGERISGWVLRSGERIALQGEVTPDG